MLRATFNFLINPDLDRQGSRKGQNTPRYENLFSLNIIQAHDNACKHMIMHALCSAMIEYVMNGLWTLFFLWCVMEYKLFGVCIVSKGAEKTRFNLKMIQNAKSDL